MTINSKVARGIFQTVFVLLFLLYPVSYLHAYPDAEVVGTTAGYPPFDFDVSSGVSGFLLTSDRRFVISFGETLELADLGSFALEATQPPALSEDDDNDGTIASIGYSSSRNEIVAPQTDGDVIFFDLDNVSATPEGVTIATDHELGPVAIDDAGTTAYVADNTGFKVHVLDLVGRTFTSTAALGSGFSFTDAVYVDDTDEAYFTTSTGTIFYIAAGATTAGSYEVKESTDLAALDATTTGTFLYVVSSAANDPVVYKVSTASHTKTSEIILEYNSSPTDLVIAAITNDSPYAYIAGGDGVSVIDTGSDEVLDFDSGEEGDQPIPTSYTANLLVPSSATDGFVYMSYSTGSVGVLTSNPFVSITGLTYPEGEDSLGSGGAVTLTFNANGAGTYEIRAGGSVDATGELLVDSLGVTSGSIEAATDASVIINYDDNSVSFQEGANDLWVFVTAGGDRGRRAATLSVDTPPPEVVIRSTGFGNQRIYVTFDRATAEDMASYNIYVDGNADEVLTKTEVAANVAHESSGDTQTASVGGLTNGRTYYIAIEGVDSAGNVSVARAHTLPDGSLASAMPEDTTGPAGLLGERGGCGIVERGSPGIFGCFEFAVVTVFILLMARKEKGQGSSRLRGSPQTPARRCASSPQHQTATESGEFTRRERALVPFLLHRSSSLFIVVMFLLVSHIAWAQEAGPDVVERPIAAKEYGIKESPQWWSVEVKTGFWLPKNAVLDRFFTPCCNLISRVQGGLLVHRRYGVEAGVGFLYKSAQAVGAQTQRESEDRFSLILIPIETNFVWRIDYFDWRYLVPFVKSGIDYVFFREALTGTSTNGFKYGMHGAGGVMVNVGELGGVAENLDADFGINDFFAVLEAQYQWIDTFGGSGLDLSGQLYSIGLLFEF